MLLGRPEAAGAAGPAHADFSTLRTGPRHLEGQAVSTVDFAPVTVRAPSS